LGRLAFITHIYHRLKPKQTLPAISIKEHGGTRTEKGADDEEITTPSHGSLIMNQQKKEKKRKKRNSPTLNIITHLKLKATAGTTKGKHSLYSLKLKTNVQSKDKTGF